MSRGLSVVVGPIGSGKSSLLQGLVEYLPPGEGEGEGRETNWGGGGGGADGRQVRVVTSDNRAAFCPDTPWIVNASARDNICLG